MQYKHINPEIYFKMFDDPLWYLSFVNLPEVRAAFYGENENLTTIQTWDAETRKIRREIRGEIYSIVLEAFGENKIYFGSKGKNWDVTRQKIDTIVIHCHDSENLIHDDLASVIPLIRLYVPSYALASADNEKYRKPIWSNHFDEKGQMNFWTYHWVIREDGTTKRLLHDNEIGWHAGNWDMNTRSVAICLPSNFAQDEPPQHILEAVATIIKGHYSLVPREKIIGHCEVARDPKYTNTIWCPGKLFLSHWKTKIVEMLSC